MMNLPLNGIIHVTGEHDTGKTTFALECGADPSRIAFIDGDMKGQATAREMKKKGHEFGAFYDLTELGRGMGIMSQAALHMEYLDLIGSIKPDTFDAIVWDTWTRCAKTFRHWVIGNPLDFRNPGEWSKMGRIKGGEMNQEALRYEARVIGQLLKLAPTVILVTHLKSFYMDQQKTDKLVPASSRTLNRVPRLRLWLRHNPASPVPIGLVLKRLDEKTMTDRGLRTTCILPRKIVPLPTEQSLWDSILRYYENPVGLRPPTPEETPNEYELSILDGTLTEDQKYTLRLLLKASVPEEAEEAVPELSMEERITALAAEGKTVEEIAAEVDRPPPVVKAVLGA